MPAIVYYHPEFISGSYRGEKFCDFSLLTNDFTSNCEAVLYHYLSLMLKMENFLEGKISHLGLILMVMKYQSL